MTTNKKICLKGEETRCKMARTLALQHQNKPPRHRPTNFPQLVRGRHYWDDNFCESGAANFRTSKFSSSAKLPPGPNRSAVLDLFRDLSTLLLHFRKRLPKFRKFFLLPIEVSGLLYYSLNKFRKTSEA